MARAELPEREVEAWADSSCRRAPDGSPGGVGVAEAAWTGCLKDDGDVVEIYFQ